jgi:nucleotide-binding universal stress UspA family protein
MKILLGVDGSEYSAAAAEAVATRPWPAGTTVRVLTAMESVVPPAAELWYDAGGNLERARQEITARAEQLTAGVAETLRASGLNAETATLEGDPRTVIVDEAERWPADLIVIGTHGYTGIKRWLLGSVAQAVVSHAPCSVEVVRKRPAEDART